jgi:beta-N-acetylhexosaminidase
VEFESNGLSREEIRKKRRKKERMQAMLALAVVCAAIVLLIGVGVFALVRMTGGKNNKAQAQIETQESEKTVDADTAASAQGMDEQAVDDADAQTEAEEDAADAQEASRLDEPDADTEDETQTSEAQDEQSETEALEQRITEQIESMSLEEKVGALFIVTPSQLMGTESTVTTVGSSFGEKLTQYPVSGIVLDASNMTDLAQTKDLVSCIKLYGGDDFLISVVDEGGDDSPFVTAGISENVISSEQEIGESLGAAGAYSAGISIGSELKQYGFNVNLAPLVDVSLKDESVAQSRGFGADQETTAELGKNLVKGLTDQNIAAAVKYFPSYGDVTQDGSSGQVISQRTKADLEKEYEPYLEAIDAGAKFVMVSHVSLPKVRGDNRPASLSAEIITDIIRDEWQYDGIVITDFMNKSCMYQKYTYAEAAVGAIEAGADLILAPKNLQKSYDGILNAVKKGQLTEERIDESLRRIYRVRFS